MHAVFQPLQYGTLKGLFLALVGAYGHMYDEHL